MCLLLGLPFSAIATAGKRGTAGTGGHAEHPGGLRVLGVSRQTCTQRFLGEMDVFRILKLQTHLLVLFSLFLGG